MTPNLEHLLELARRGRDPAATGAERQARRLVRCILETAIGLDGSATAGIRELTALVQANPQSGRESAWAVIR